ncbi:MAG: WecB/TagA/CpsF family glycosyltransferase [Vampirovibrionales bacterium]|nr:WecB/TagA/CpsF family glycosyltransferase [Vampirovibrionales bacterium]
MFTAQDATVTDFERPEGSQVDLMRVGLLGYPVDLANTLAAYGQAACTLLTQSNEALSTVTLNPEVLMLAEQTPWLAAHIRAAQLVLPDGAGLVWALNRAGAPAKRMPGIEFAWEMLAACAARQWPVALIGASEDTNLKACNVLNSRIPGLNLAYAHSGYFNDAQHEAEVALACAQHQPKLVLLALGAPKQDAFIVAHRDKFTDAALLMGVGGSFDVWAGTVKRAPEWLRALQLEWAWRLAGQPWRIRRSVPPLCQFVMRVLRT